MNSGIVRKTCGKVMLVVMIVGISLLSSGCGSTAVNQMLTQAQKGVTAGKKNDAMLVEKIRKEIQTEINLLNKSVDRDVEMMQAGAIKDKDGKVVPMDAEWVKQMRIGYFLALQSKYKELERLKEVQAAMDGNTEMVARLVDESKKLNMGYITTFNGVGLLINQLNAQGEVDVSDALDTDSAENAVSAEVVTPEATKVENTDTTNGVEILTTEKGE